MNTEYKNYPFLNKDLVTSSLVLSLMAQQLKQNQSMETNASVVTAIAEQTAKLKSAMWRQNYENEKAFKRQKIQFAFACHPIRSITDLRYAPLHAKRETLNAMAIVPVAVAASYLGVAKCTIYRLPHDSGIDLWEKHLGVQAMSINQLTLLAQNPAFYDQRHVGISAQAFAETILDHSIMLDEETASAFLNAPRSELLALAQCTYFYRARFRLAELEQIRVAKLNQLAAVGKRLSPAVSSKLVTLEAM